MSNVFSCINFKRDKFEKDRIQKRKEIELLLDPKTVKFFNFYDLSDSNSFKDKLNYLIQEKKLQPQIKVGIQGKNNITLTNKKESIKTDKLNIFRNHANKSQKPNPNNLIKRSLKGFKNSSLSIKKLLENKKENSKTNKVEFEGKRIIKGLSKENETEETSNIFKTLITTQNEYYTTEDDSKNVLSRNTNHLITKASEINYNSSEGNIITRNSISTTKITNEHNVFITFSPNISLSKLQKSYDKKLKLKEKYNRFISEIKTFQPSNLLGSSDDKDVNYIQKYLMNEGDKFKRTTRRNVSLPENRTELMIEPYGNCNKLNKTSRKIHNYCNTNIRNCNYLYSETKNSVDRLNERVRESLTNFMEREDFEKKFSYEKSKNLFSNATNHKQLLLTTQLVKRAKSSITNRKIK